MDMMILPIDAGDSQVKNLCSLLLTLTLKSTIIYSLFGSASIAFAEGTYSDGVRLGIKFELAYALATCRTLGGEKKDWLSYYFQKFDLPKELAFSLVRNMPPETIAKKVGKVIDHFGSCKNLLKVEEEDGIEGFQERYMKPAYQSHCSQRSQC